MWILLSDKKNLKCSKGWLNNVLNSDKTRKILYKQNCCYNQTKHYYIQWATTYQINILVRKYLFTNHRISRYIAIINEFNQQENKQNLYYYKEINIQRFNRS